MKAEASNFESTELNAVGRRIDMHCKDCGNPLRRLARKGFLQLKVYPKFGYYPWECPICRTLVMVRKQYIRKRRSLHEPSAN
jgi:hypothetical protein